MADETIVVEFLVKVDKAIADTKSMREAVDQAKVALKQAAQETSESIAFVNKQFALQRKEAVQAAKGTAEYQLVLQKSAREALAFAQAQKELTGKTAQAQSGFSKLGDVGKFVFGTVLGITAVGAFNALRTALSNMMEEGKNFLQTMYRFEASVRNLQRRGLDITIEKSTAQVKNLRKEFGIFTTQELMGAVANVQLLTANFGFSTAEMEKMTRQAVVLSVITGKTIDEAAKELALFYSSGYSEGLQRAGLAINKLTVSTEAYNQGLINSKTAYSSLNEYQRAHIAYQVVEEQMTTLNVDATRILTTEYGKLLDAQKDLEEEQNNLALATVPLSLAWTKLKLDVLKVFQGLRQGFLDYSSDFIKTFVVPTKTGIDMLIALWDKFINKQDVQLQDWKTLYDKNMKEVMDAYKGFLAVDVNPFKAMKNAPKGQPQQPGGEDTADAADEQTKMLESIYKEFLDIIQGYNEKYLEAQQEYLDKVGSQDENTLDSVYADWNQFFSNRNNLSYDAAKELLGQEETIFGEFGSITEEGLYKALEIWQNYYDKIDDINRKLGQDIEDENRDYQNDLADLEFETQQKLEDAARKYHYDQLRAEREFQEKMRRLREEFLYDLEDALRERDALAVLRLIRRYRLDVDQAKRQYELERQERLEAYRQEIEDIKRQAERKREELAIEHERKLAELQLDAERERQQAEQDRQRAMDELISDMERSREEAKAQRDQDLAQLKADMEAQLAELLVQYGQQEGVTEAHVQTMANLFASYLGKGGLIDISVTEFIGMVQNATQVALAELEKLRQIKEQMDALSGADRNPENENTPSEGGNGQPKSAGGHAGFGKYTLGEQGEEFVIKSDVLKKLEHNFGRLTQSKLLSLLNQNPNMHVTMLSPKDSGKGSIEHSVKISLSEGLVGEIMDQTMDETSKIYLASSRERR